VKKYATDFESGYVAVVIGESNLDQTVKQPVDHSHRPVGECSVFFPLATLLAFLLALVESTS